LFFSKKEKLFMESTTLVAPDISCEHCQHAIERGVGKLEGASQVKVEIPTKTVHIDYDPAIVTRAKIEEVLDETGYTVAK
jgi:copper ion binding protein